MKTKLTIDQYIAEGEKLFGPNRLDWRFVCPCCGYIASAADYKDAGAPEGAVGFSCIGRWWDEARDAFDAGPGPCNYAGGGLIRVSPIEVEGNYYFDFDRTALKEKE